VTEMRTLGRVFIYPSAHAWERFTMVSLPLTATDESA
jgi:hypothetical protein